MPISSKLPAGTAIAKASAVAAAAGSSAPASPAGSSPAAELVRIAVHGLLERAPAWHAVADSIRAGVADAMVTIGTFIVEPDGERADRLAGAVSVAPLGAGSSPVQEASHPLDFPTFVSNLIDGVFDAIVDSSIQQMEAYGQMLKDVAATVGEFAQSTVTDDDARKFLARARPALFVSDTVSSDASSGTDPLRLARLARAHPAAAGAGPLTPQAQGDDALAAQAGRRAIAARRQQLVVAALLAGINRIVVTDSRVDAATPIADPAATSAPQAPDGGT